MKFRILFVAFTLISLTTSLWAADISPSQFSLFTGDKFYILTDGVFTSDQKIEVRFESGGNPSLKQYEGVDVRLYRIPKPLNFLKAQKNLHRPSVQDRYSGEGLENALSYLWDSWFKKSRLAWQRIFSPEARKNVVSAAPQLEQIPAHSYSTKFKDNPQFAPLKEFDLINSFRYPIWSAKPYSPNKNTKMEGSSSEFIETQAGNVMLYMGKQKPGLYLVEAFIGSFRATTLVFVSDTLAVTKVSSQQALVWSVNRLTGLSQPDSQVVITDGVGILENGKTGSDGVFVAKRSIPERTYAMVEDRAGGVSVSENFFYDSEIFQGKVFVFTDRPLYQPGEKVIVRALGRDLKREGSKDVWSSLPAKNAHVSVLDSTGVVLLNQKLNWDAVTGGEVRFKLPEESESGGYALRLSLDGEVYGAAFRVARFTKPHFDSQIIFDKVAYRVGESVTGKVVLRYPSGQPVVGAQVRIQLKAEQMSMYEGSYAYSGPMAVELTEKNYESDANGEIKIKFPAAQKPSRYIASARAQDDAAFYVSSQKVILIEGFLETYILKSEVSSSRAGDPVKVTYRRQGDDAADTTLGLSQWQAIRLEDRTVTVGSVKNTDVGEFTMNLAKSGHYVVRVVDKSGVTRGTRSHVILGEDLKSVTGQLEILADKEEYSIGDTAQILLTFPFKMDDALLTLERNDVGSFGRLSSEGRWFKSQRISDTQWKVEVPISDLHSPNIVFSVAYAKDREFGFHNKGLSVKKPLIEVTFKPEKALYAPGEKVVVEVETKLGGKPVSSLVAVGVVDEMIYSLQPEIAPSIGEFFHHQRRNQVRTTSSLSFYSFNPATSSSTAEVARSARRDLKVLQERARRDSQDTAYWNGKLQTGTNGKVKFEFIMPDALTQWRITGRAILISGNLGAVGEAKGFVRSNKDYFMKWTGPTRFRDGDKPKPAMVAFNSTSSLVNAEILLQSSNYSFTQNLTMKPGANSVVLTQAPTQSQILSAKIKIAGKTVDNLESAIEFVPETWRTQKAQSMRLDQPQSMAFLASAKNVRVKIVPEATHQVLRIADDLMEYPWGCVEQTASRLIPLTMVAAALKSNAVGGQDGVYLQTLMDRIALERRRLVSMAGSGAVFTWWGDETGGDLFITAHAYYADWRAARLLGIQLPKENGEQLLKIYAKSSSPSSMSRVYTLWVLLNLGQPIGEQLSALSKIVQEQASLTSKSKVQTSSSVFMDEVDLQRDLVDLLIANLKLKQGMALDPALKKRVDNIVRSGSVAPAYQAAILWYKVQTKLPGNRFEEAQNILNQVSIEVPTIDRALTLALVEQALPQNVVIKSLVPKMDLGSGWIQDSKGAITSYLWSKSPSALSKVSLPKIPGAVAEVTYEQAEDFKSSLPLTVTRQLYRLELMKSEEDESRFNAIAVVKGAVIDSRALYIDEVKVSGGDGRERFMLLEVPLPPGGQVDGTTWGLSFEGIEANFTNARPASSGLGYATPIETLGTTTKTFHQLVRFSSRGTFKLPPAKVFKMYRPSDRAFEKDPTLREITVQ